jgi:hypothetical protein
VKILGWLALVPFLAWVGWSLRLDLAEVENDVIAMVAIFGKIVGIFIVIGTLGYGVVWGGKQLGWW